MGERCFGEGRKGERRASRIQAKPLLRQGHVYTLGKINSRHRKDVPG